MQGIAEEWNRLWGQASADIQKEIDKLPGEAQKLALTESQKLVQSLSPTSPQTPPLQQSIAPPKFVANLATKFSVAPWMIYAGLGGAALLTIFLMSSRRK